MTVGGCGYDGRAKVSLCGYVAGMVGRMVRQGNGSVAVAGATALWGKGVLGVDCGLLGRSWTFTTSPSGGSCAPVSEGGSASRPAQCMASG